MKKQRETLTGKEEFCKEGTFSTASLILHFQPPRQYRTHLLSASYPAIPFVEKNLYMCGRFLSVASLQGLIHEGTMTSLCMAMTEELHKSVVIDCSGPQPQFYNAGEPQPEAALLALL